MNFIRELLPKIDFTELTHGLFGAVTWGEWVRALVLFIVGIIIAKIVSAIVTRAMRNNASIHQTMLIRKVVYYITVLLFIMLALDQVMDITTILGATGIVAIAVGFGSRTSTSNIIGGMFLIAEQPFVIGDTISLADNTTGEVIAIDLLAIKLRTDDNVLLRVPNDLLIKKQFRNLTRFSIRRLDLALRIAFADDIAKLEQVLLDLVLKMPLCLESPKAILRVKEFNDSGVSLQFSVWVENANYYDLKTQLLTKINDEIKAQRVKLTHPCQQVIINR